MFSSRKDFGVIYHPRIMLAKCLVVVLLVTTPFVTAKIELPPDLLELLGKIRSDCFQELGMTEGDLKKFDIKKPNPTMNCYIRCLFTHVKWMSSDEVLQTDFIKQNIHSALKPVTLPYLDNCGKKSAQGGECEKSYNFFMCMNQAAPEDWILM